MKTKTCILIPYFGPLPLWFDFFLLSCSRNISFDWIFFTDQIQPNTLYANTRFESMSLDQFNRLASDKLGFKIRIQHPYKLCDLKPSYGRIFEDFTKGYDYWGYGDIDLIYGDIARFISENPNHEYDVFSNHTGFIPGHLCILKNSEKVKSLFMKVKSYKKIFQSPLYKGFDELLHPISIIPSPIGRTITKRIKTRYHLILSAFVRFLRQTPLYRYKLLFRSNRIKITIPKDFTSVVFLHAEMGTLRLRSQISYQCDLMLHEKKIRDWEIEWKDGKLYNRSTGDELMYFHFFMAKENHRFRIKEFKPGIQTFFVTKTGIR